MLILYIFLGILTLFILFLISFYLIILFYLRQEFITTCLDYEFSKEESKRLWKHSKNIIIDQFLKEISRNE